MDSFADILRPPTYWVGNRCYRVLNPAAVSQSTTNYAEGDAYSFEDAVYQDEVECTQEMPEVQIDQLDNGKFQTSFPVANTYFSYIIGSKGATKKRIENDTFTQIRIPAKGQTGDIVIIGRDIKTVRQARIKIEMLVEQARKKMPPTHFLSMPTNHPDVQERFLKFKEEVLEKCGDCRGVGEDIFPKPEKLHLTLCVMVLADERERHQAVDVLKLCPESVLRKQLAGQPLKVELKGLEYMNDDPEEVDVLYGQVTALNWSHSLQSIADSLVDEFIKAGIAKQQRERVKLHVTLMNTSFRNRQEGVEEERTGRERESFSAQRILEEFGDYYFGIMEIEEVHLSLRHTNANSGYYSASAKIRVFLSPI
ncbi:activating signal cointegrator 1 complex subunit [Halocaridina rubra]|uniref:Activating signal cointegrator 1 complex subunit n=1 Tax=Halocaridina rubra TaxID=373956 RepID=A0AAN9AAM0_HALRR